MTPERWQQIDRLFAAALLWQPDQRLKLLREACAGDEELRLEVESLLSAHAAANSKIEAPGAADGLRLLLDSDPSESPTTVGTGGQSPTHPESRGGITPPVAHGSTLDRYLVLKQLGGGGMGVVFSAYDPQLDRKIALKLLRPDTFGKGRASEGRARLLREAQAMARLSHPNVIAVFDVGTFNDQVFIAMEYIDGSTLTRWLKEKQHSWRAVLDVFIEAGRGLAAAHASGLIHRDFKPDNVLVGNDGRVRVLDFGLARATQGEDRGRSARSDTLPNLAPASGDSPLDSRLTQPGLLMGTPAYMAPEQLTASTIDARTDQFAFCVALYEGLYGELPFEKTPGPPTRRRIKEPPKSARVPKAVREVLLRGLMPRREDRFASMRELLVALEAAARRRRRRAALALMLLLGTVAIAGVAWMLRSRPQGVAEPARFHRITDSGRDYSPAAPLDGRFVAFTSERDGSPRIWLKRLPGGQELALTAGRDARPRLSPDGSRVMYVHDEGTRNALYLSQVEGGGARKAVDDASDGDFAPDGRRVAFIRLDPQTGAGTTIEIASVDGSNAREIFRLRAGAGSLDSPRWSPDGSMIAVRQAAASTGVPDSILLVQTNGTGSRQITPPGPPGRISALAFSESGKALIYGQSESLTSTRANVSTRMVRLNVATLEADTLFWVPERVQAVTLAGAGRLVFDAHSTLENLRESPIGSVAEREARWLTRGRSNDRQPVYSPDGEWLAFSSDRSGNLDLWKVSTKTGALKQLTDDAAADWDPAFTRDGKCLLWSSNRSGPFEIWTANADGSGARQLSHDGVDAENPTATPDGQWIVYGSANPAHSGIWKIRADGSEATRVAAGTAVWPEVSPDGSYAVYRNAAYDWPDSRVRDISMRVVRIADGTVMPFEIKLKNGQSAGRARWLPDGRGLAFIAPDEQGVNGVWAQDFVADQDTSATRRRLSGFSSKAVTESFSIARDGTRITIAETETLSSLMIADRVSDLSPAR